jgi:tetratricopeptide (TPR) repeat protein
MVNSIDTQIKSGRGARLVVRGYGGIGKTSVALAVCHHMTIRELFGNLRFFVECEAANTPALLLQEIAARLRIDLSNGNAHTFVIAGLETISPREPLLLILDNAETFLDNPNHTHAKEIEDILSDIAALHRVTLILTKRGIEQPVSVEWDWQEELGVLDLDAAREVFLSITTTRLADSLDHSQVDSLLIALDCVPLAVKLLAQVAQSGNESLEQLHKRWERRKTDLLKLHGRDHRETSVNASIQVSLQSQLMEEHPNAIRLLSIVSYLPEGLSFTHMEEFATECNLDLDSAAHLLKRLSLAHKSSNGHFLTTLSPIREHVSRYHSVGVVDADAVNRWHLKMANKGDCRPGDPTFLSSQAELKLHKNNISSVLRGCIEGHLPSHNTILSTINFSKFLYWSAPNGDLLRLILDSEHTNEIDAPYRGRLLFQLQSILSTLGDTANAIVVLQQARSEFRVAGESVAIAQCAQELGDILYIMDKYQDARLCFEEARTEFEKRDLRECAAQCTKSIGNILFAQSDYGASRDQYEHAYSDFKSLGSSLGVAHCIKSLGDIYSAQREYSKAKDSYQEARNEFETIGDRLAAAQCLKSLGFSFYQIKEYENASDLTEKARAELEEMGDRFGVAGCLRCLGLIFYDQEDYSNAKMLLSRALTEFELVGDRSEAAECGLTIGVIHIQERDYFNAGNQLLGARVRFESIGKMHKVDQCDRILALVSRYFVQ